MCNETGDNTDLIYERGCRENLILIEDEYVTNLSQSNKSHAEATSPCFVILAPFKIPKTN